MISDVIKNWRKGLFSTYDWHLDTLKSPTSGALSGVWLRPCADAPFGAYLKPTTYICPFPAAAKEKIAADLAYDVGVAVAPVLLFRSAFRFGTVQEHCCISLRTHSKTPVWSFLWTEAVQSTPVGAVLRSAAAERLSALFVFDLWIDNRDRCHAGNVIFGEDEESPSRSGFVGIDHSISMGAAQSWKDEGWKTMTAPPFPDELRRVLDKSVMLRSAELIENLADEKAVECVRRIPSDFLDPTEGTLIITGLLHRKKQVKAFILQNL